MSHLLDCRSEVGITVGLVDSCITAMTLLSKRDLTPGPVVEALRDLLESTELWTVIKDVPLKSSLVGIPDRSHG